MLSRTETAAPRTGVAAGRPGRIDGLDLLRGLAVVLVMARHAFPTPFAGAGVVGVVMFFTLSGYLITGLLEGELRATGRLRLGRFYLRRAARLVPALLVLLVGFVAVTLTVDPLGDRGRLVATLVVALTWSANLPLAHVSPAVFHLWTLATEEQFYLLWPVLLAVASRSRRLGASLAGVALLCVLVCVGTQVWLRGDPNLAYTIPTSWALCFVVGASVRLDAERLDPSPVVRRLLVPLALLGLLVLSVVPLRGHALTYVLGGPVIAALTAVLLVCWRTWRSVEQPLVRPLVWVGTVSYGTYLWDYPLTLWLRPGLGAGAGVVAAGLTLLVAAGSWYAVERPVQQWWAARGSDRRAGAAPHGSPRLGTPTS